MGQTDETYSTYDFTEQDNILSADEEEAVPALCENIPVVYSLNCVFQYEVGYAKAKELSTTGSTIANLGNDRVHTKLIIRA